mgnify:CR=1 FL=1
MGSLYAPGPFQVVGPRYLESRILTGRTMHVVCLFKQIGSFQPVGRISLVVPNLTVGPFSSVTPFSASCTI